MAHDDWTTGADDFISVDIVSVLESLGQQVASSIRQNVAFLTGGAMQLPLVDFVNSPWNLDWLPQNVPDDVTGREAKPELAEPSPQYSDEYDTYDEYEEYFDSYID